MQRWQFSIRQLFAVTVVVALASGLVQQVGIEEAAKCWCGPVVFAVGIWLIAAVPSETRRRIKLIPVVMGAILGASLAGVLIVLDSFHWTGIRAPDPRRIRIHDSDIIRVFLGGVIGSVLVLLSSWHWTRARLGAGAKSNTDQPQSPPPADGSPPPWSGQSGTTTSADFCPTPSCFGMHGPGFRASPTPRYVGQISPDKNVNFPRATAAFTLTPW
jgi:hypothetical protein